MLNEEMIIVSCPDGDMPVYVTSPAGEGQYPAVIMYQNVAGLGEHMREMARRVAAQGYVCAVPDNYYRLGKILFNADSKDPYWPQFRDLVAKMVRESGRLMEDTRALISALRGVPKVAPGPMGTVGFCGGGRQALVAAGVFPDDIKATASFFPVYLIDYDDQFSPHRRVSEYSGGVYIAFAEHDHSLSLDEASAFEDLMKQRCNAEWISEVHTGTEHAFAFPGRPSYNESAAERAWAQIFPMLKQHLSAA